MITREVFNAACVVLGEALPYGRALSPQTLAVLWSCWPEEAKQQLENEDLQHAIACRLMDPEAPKDMAVSTVLLHYLYPRRDGALVFDRGPRRVGVGGIARAEQRVFRAGGDGPMVEAPEAVSAAVRETLRQFVNGSRRHQDRTQMEEEALR